MTSTSTAPRAEPPQLVDSGRTRLAALDGLRGVTIILVVLGHTSSYLWPLEGIRSTPYLRGLVGGGAVSLFFIVSGFIVTRGLLRDHDGGTLDPLRFLVRRLIRVGAQLLPLCLTIVVVSRLDATDTDSVSVTTRTVTNTLTYTHNILYQQNPLGARADMGHLWFLSIQQQWYLLVPLLVILLAGRRRLFAALVLVGALASMTYRVGTLSDSTWFDLAISTFGRADALLMGVLLAVALPALHRGSRVAGAAAMTGAVVLVVLILTSKEGDPLAFLGWWSVAFVLTGTVVVAGLVAAARPSALHRLLQHDALTWLGRASLAIYVWHYPLIFFVSRHTTSWTWLPQTITFLAALAAVTYASNRWVEIPMRAWLGTHLRGPARPSTTRVTAS